MTANNNNHQIQQLDMPEHIGIIMDGNGRWAQQRGLPRLQGHIEGTEATKRVVRACAELGIGALSVYAFSAENWQRPAEEVDGIMALIEDSIRQEMESLHERNCRLIASGRLHELPDSLREAIQRGIDLTKDNTGLIVNVLVNYGGRAEIVDAARSLCEQAVAGRLDPESIDEQLFAQHIYSPQLNDPELILRPGGEFRLSNFLLWEIAYSEIVILPVLWPDFERKHLIEGITEFNNRQRRFGGLPDDESANAD